MSSGLKRIGSRVNISIKGGGPLGGLFADAGLDGTVRAYMENSTVERSI